MFVGQSMVLLVDRRETPEVLARVGRGGTIRVSDVATNPEYVYYPETPGDPAPDFSWKGEHPDYGVWSVETLQNFLNRPEVAQRNPYVRLDIAWTDNVADVIRRLAALRKAAGS